jgi:hypothetical protein
MSPAFSDQLSRLVADWPLAFLDLVRDPERVAIVCRAARDLIQGRSST